MQRVKLNVFNSLSINHAVISTIENGIRKPIQSNKRCISGKVWIRQVKA